MQRMLTLIALTLVVLLPRTAVQAQEESPQGPTLDTVLDQFDVALKAKDSPAVLGQVDAVLNLFLENKIEDKEYRKVCDRLSKAFALNRNELQIKAAQILGNFGKYGASELLRFFKDRGLKSEEKLSVYYAVIQGLGLTRDAAAMKALTRLLNDKDTPVVVAAVEALGHFQETPDAMRKEIVKEVIKNFTSAFSAAQDPRKTAQVAKFDAIAAPFNNTLQALTGASPGNAEAWQKWFNENKKRKW